MALLHLWQHRLRPQELGRHWWQWPWNRTLRANRPPFSGEAGDYHCIGRGITLLLRLQQRCEGLAASGAPGGGWDRRWGAEENREDCAGDQSGYQFELHPEQPGGGQGGRLPSLRPLIHRHQQHWQLLLPQLSPPNPQLSPIVQEAVLRKGRAAHELVQEAAC